MIQWFFVQDDCTGAAVLQSLPQDTEHFATSVYDANTTCEQVKTPQLRPRSYTEERSLEFASILTPAAQALPYTVCSETSWTVLHNTEKLRVGPLDTFVFFDNTCQNGSVTVRVSVTESESASMRL